MPTTATRPGRKTGPVHGLKSLALTDGAGTYEAIVSVFGNVDYAGDRVLFGAFTSSLERWKSSGDPIPVVFAHQWDDLDAHVGEVLDVKELPPGDPGLPPELAGNGGLWVKFRLDVDEDFAGRLAKRLDRRTIREFSFAYDVLDERRAGDGANDLVELDVIEVGPCLKGMNPSTALLARAAKALREAGEDALADELGAGSTAPGRKSVPVTFSGSAEELQGALIASLYEWASAEDLGRGGFYAVHLEATFGERAVVTVEGWDDPIGTGTPYEVPYSFDAEARTVELGEPVEVVVEATTAAKSRRFSSYAKGATPDVKAPRPEVDEKATAETLAALDAVLCLDLAE